MLNRIVKLAIVTAVTASLTLTFAGCTKGGSATNGPSEEGGISTLSMWTHNAGNTDELNAIEQVVSDYNASQTKYKVELQAFPQDSYNQSVVAAASAKKLPCILDIDGPNVPNWAWAGYLAPIEGMDDTLSKFLPTVLGKWSDKTYSYGYYDVALNLATRTTTLEKYDIRIPSMDKPWTKDEFTAALKKVKDSGDFQYPLDLQTGNTGEWWPYAYSPFLQSAGGDLINRSDFKSADSVLNGPEAVAWGEWFRSLVTEEYMPLKSGADPAKDFLNGKTAILYTGSWSAADAREKFGDDVLFVPPVDLGKGPKIGGGSWQWGISTQCGAAEGAQDYMKFAAADKYVASVSKATGTIPATDAGADMVPGYEAGGENDIFRQFSKKYALLRPETPGYPFIATEFTKIAQDILNGADPKTALDTAVKNIDANQESNNFFE
ncbi:MAG: sugar ABC transporter substrate-binding protein [Propionibacteriaceae bacterium]|nr:sugar ABC transporter substrate-binding protein [Propionibacteriaceae bacterium]